MRLTNVARALASRCVVACSKQVTKIFEIAKIIVLTTVSGFFQAGNDDFGNGSAVGSSSAFAGNFNHGIFTETSSKLGRSPIVRVGQHAAQVQVQALQL